LVLSHGGAFHRGSKEDDAFEQDGHRNTAIAHYCRLFAARGYVCFSVGYRLTQELPALPAHPVLRDPEGLQPGRIDEVRALMGLPPATRVQLVNGIEAAVADVAAAFRCVLAKADDWQIDTDRIAIGGFSAGGIASLYAAYGIGVPSAAVVAISASLACEVDGLYCLRSDPQRQAPQPPLFMVSSEHDLPGMHERTLMFIDQALEVGLPAQHYFAPAVPHFYEHTTPVQLLRATASDLPSSSTVETAMADFLANALQP
jgi:dienelactone hydrolase